MVIPVESFAVAPVTVEVAYCDEPMVRLTIGADTSSSSDGAPPRHIDMDHREARAIAAALVHFADERATEDAMRYVS